MMATCAYGLWRWSAKQKGTKSRENPAFIGRTLFISCSIVFCLFQKSPQDTCRGNYMQKYHCYFLTLVL